MITVVRHAVTRRQASALLTLPVLLALALTVSACGSGGSSASGPGTHATTAAQTACQQVSVVLTNGPDPGTDPVGYAEAQVLPLRQIHTTDPALSKAISALADEYASYSAANGKGKAVTAALATAINRINSACPGAGATA